MLGSLPRHQSQGPRSPSPHSLLPTRQALPQCWGDSVLGGRGSLLGKLTPTGRAVCREEVGEDGEQLQEQEAVREGDRRTERRSPDLHLEATAWGQVGGPPYPHPNPTQRGGARVAGLPGLAVMRMRATGSYPLAALPGDRRESGGGTSPAQGSPPCGVGSLSPGEK